MPFFLSSRDTVSKERMDDPNCDADALHNTYRQFRVINALISRWRAIYRNFIKPELTDSPETCSLLDIGFGGGDIPLKLAQWASTDHLNLEITAIETDKRAHKFVQSLDTPPNVTYRLVSSTELLQAGHSYDIVISNHMLHHLDRNTFLTMLEEARKLSTRMVLFNDIERSDVGYFLFNLFSRPLFRSSFITHDGLTSIKRSYTFKELQKALPPHSHWAVQRLFPFRLLLSYRHD